jgi:ADP-ribosylglycohydrolase
VEQYAAVSAAVTHNHPEGVKGAQAAAAAMFMARKGESKEAVREYVEGRYGYDLRRTLAEIRPGYTFNETCQETVPEAVIAFLESTGFEEAIRQAVSLGGDSDTLAAITGGIAEAVYGLPADIEAQARARLDETLLAVYDRWKTQCPGANRDVAGQS